MNARSRRRVTIQPIRRFGLDASIIFSDILVPLEAMGLPLSRVRRGSAPSSALPQHYVSKLVVPDPSTTMAFVADAIRIVCRELPTTPLIGFCGAPFTLACYAIEGSGSSNYHDVKKFFFDEPRVARALTAKLVETVSLHLVAQIDAGASAVQIFDSWAGILSREDYLGFALTPTIEIVERVRRKHPNPIIVFAKAGERLFAGARAKRRGCARHRLDDAARSPGRLADRKVVLRAISIRRCCLDPPRASNVRCSAC